MKTPILNTAIEAFDKVGLVGSAFRKNLAPGIASKLLLREGRDSLMLTGPSGTGKSLTALACHEAISSYAGRSGAFVEVSCQDLTGSHFEECVFGDNSDADADNKALITQASGGTLFFDHLESLSTTEQRRLLSLLDNESADKKTDTTGAGKSDAIVILSATGTTSSLQNGEILLPELVERAKAWMPLSPLYERRQDIGELAQHFAQEAAIEFSAETSGGIQVEDFAGLTRRARSEIEAAFIANEVASIRVLRNIVRDAFFEAAFAHSDDDSFEYIESSDVIHLLQERLGYNQAARERVETTEIEDSFETLAGRVELHQIATRHGIEPQIIEKMATSVELLIHEMEGSDRSYRHVTERINRLSKIALWLVSSSKTQADFRRFFGHLDAEMPTKSVAHQIYHEVFSYQCDGGQYDGGHNLKGGNRS